MQPMRVIADNEDGLLLWHPAGSDFARLVDADGKTQHELTIDQSKLIAAGEFPFDGTYTDFRPDHRWPVLRLPAALGSQPSLTEEHHP
ncbi:hypothetical protein ACNAW0_28045 [Micromonospora sp. SL1-18]|uniref:hypothetical protein n=1 Tax=Micromonospora sp. SL1-18 TaxID=3399128 RepID=UPI003A4DB3FD